jgi:hypothetical protein
MYLTHKYPINSAHERTQSSGHPKGMYHSMYKKRRSVRRPIPKFPIPGACAGILFICRSFTLATIAATPCCPTAISPLGPLITLSRRDDVGGVLLGEERGLEYGFDEGAGGR